MKQTNEIESIRIKITDPYTLELVTESATEYKARVRERLEDCSNVKQVLDAITSFKKYGMCSFIPNIAGFMVDVGLLDPNGKDRIYLVIEVLQEEK